MSTSPAFILYGHPSSINTDRVRLTLAAANITNYEWVSLDMLVGEHKSPEHVQLHPWGKVPAVRTSDGFTLYESRPICNYLAARFHCPLVPSVTDLQARALFDQAQSVEMCYFTHDTDLLMFEIAVKPAFMPGVPADADVVAGARKRLEAAFDILSTILERQKFVAGDTFSLVDIFHLPPVKRLMDCGFGDVVLDRASVHTWWQRCLEIPAIARYLNDEMVVLPPK